MVDLLCFISFVLFFPLIGLMSACRTEDLHGKVKPASAYLFMYLFLHFFFTFPVPSCALPLSPTVSSMTIVFLLLNQAKQKMYMVQIHILALSVMCPKIYLRVVFYFFPTGTSEKPLPQNAVVAEYCILSGGILMLLWATSAGWRKLRF